MFMSVGASGVFGSFHFLCADGSVRSILSLFWLGIRLHSPSNVFAKFKV